MKRFAALILVLGPCIAAGQQGLGNLGGMPANPGSGIAGQFFQGDFVNYNLFFSGLWDSANQNIGSNSGGAGGFSMGGGVSLGKSFANGGSLGLSYRGDFRDYPGGYQGTGTNQFLSLDYSRRLGRRWSISFVEGAGILFYNSPFYGSTLSPGGVPLTNPYSPTSRFLQSSVYLSYQQTARLSYVFGGTFILNRYNYGGAAGTNGGLGTASVVYRLTRRTTIGGTYSHNYYHYQGGFGQSTIDGGYANFSHIFGRGWEGHMSGGATYVRTNGILPFPQGLILITPQGPILVFALPYNNKLTVPTIQGGIRRQFGKINIGVSAGHGVNPGNGTFLTSSHTFFGGSVSRSFGRQAVIAVNGNYSNLKSIAGADQLKSQAPGQNYFNQGYSQMFLNVSYSRVILRHLSGFATYSYNRYGSIGQFSTAGDNRIIVGVAYTSKAIPFSLF